MTIPLWIFNVYPLGGIFVICIIKSRHAHVLVQIRRWKKSRARVKGHSCQFVTFSTYSRRLFFTEKPVSYGACNLRVRCWWPEALPSPPPAWVWGHLSTGFLEGIPLPHVSTSLCWESPFPRSAWLTPSHHLVLSLNVSASKMGTRGQTWCRSCA